MTSTNDCSNCKPNQPITNINTSNNNNNNNNQEPFYLHPPLSGRTTLEAPHAPQDGLYINPMNNHRHRYFIRQ